MFFSSNSKSGTNSNEQIVQYVLVAIVVVLVLYYFVTCIKDNKRNNNNNSNNANNTNNANAQNTPVNNMPADATNMVNASGYQNMEGFQNDVMEEDVGQDVNQVEDQVEDQVGASEGVENNEVQASVNLGVNGPNELPAECYPKDVLGSSDLLRNDANSTWAQTNPNGQGSLTDKNFLNAGFHVGVNTVGQSLRNANRQLRSDPPNPQVKVSPWMQTTIEPDVNRKPMEIGV